MPDNIGRLSRYRRQRTPVCLRETRLTRCASAATATHRPLHRRTFDRTVGTKDATVAYPRPQLGVAAGTLVQDDTRVGWHAFDRSEAADRTDEGGLKNR